MTKLTITQTKGIKTLYFYKEAIKQYEGRMKPTIKEGWNSANSSISHYPIRFHGWKTVWQTDFDCYHASVGATLRQLSF